VRLEYESTFALGPLCGVDDPEAVLQAVRRCDELGIDTISAGGTVAFLMECARRGLLEDDRLPSGRRLAYGDGQAVHQALAAVMSGEGLGRLLALGSRGAAAEIGKGSARFAMHVKGLELPGHDPRTMHAMALGLAVGTRGADHNRSGAYEADFSGQVDRFQGDERSVVAAIATEDRAALLDSLILCKFLRGVFPDLPAEAAEMLAAVTGWDVTADELRLVAHRVVNARRCLNEREGWTRAEDALPPALLDGDGSVGTLSVERLDGMIVGYYAMRGWGTGGRVPIDLRREMGLEGAAFGETRSIASRSSRP
jgi:aldehyde:ferredoxin oxidoreductase